jgi:hypothetical protein
MLRECGRALARRALVRALLLMRCLSFPSPYRHDDGQLERER